MKTCPRCETEKGDQGFYNTDTTCKECRKMMVSKNRAEKADYYRAYDQKRYQEDPAVRARHRRYQKTDAGKESIKRSSKKWQDNNQIKRGTNNIIDNAVRDGKLEKPDTCSECGAGGRIHGHHDDYAYPMSVRWLCPACHFGWHRENGEGLNG